MIRNTSAMIILGAITMTNSAATSPHHDEGERNKTGDESHHHPQ
jgi:hypothetical protein